jgi:hypothetical protein
MIEKTVYIKLLMYWNMEEPYCMVNLFNTQVLHGYSQSVPSGVRLIPPDECGVAIFIIDYRGCNVVYLYSGKNGPA